jgi:hypothetical protein
MGKRTNKKKNYFLKYKKINPTIKAAPINYNGNATEKSSLAE